MGQMEISHYIVWSWLRDVLGCVWEKCLWLDLCRGVFYPLARVGRDSRWWATIFCFNFQMVAQRRALMLVTLFITLGDFVAHLWFTSYMIYGSGFCQKGGPGPATSSSRVSLTGQCWLAKIKEGMTGPWGARQQVLGIGSSYCMSAWFVDFHLLRPINQPPPVGFQQYQDFGRCLVCDSQIGSYLHLTNAIGQSTRPHRLHSVAQAKLQSCGHGGVLITPSLAATQSKSFACRTCASQNRQVSQTNLPGEI